jgi:hypothetical protein
MYRTASTTVSGHKVICVNKSGSLEVTYDGKTIGFGEDAYGEDAVRFDVAKKIAAAMMAKSDENTHKIARTIYRVMHF